MSKEIVQARDRNADPNIVEQHLIEALQRPMDKLKQRSSWVPLPSGRFVEDYFQRGKLFSSLLVVGFTVNPEHCLGT